MTEVMVLRCVIWLKKKIKVPLVKNRPQKLHLLQYLVVSSVVKAKRNITVLLEKRSCA